MKLQIKILLIGERCFGLRANDHRYGYNCTEGGDGFNGKHREETKEKISSTMKGRTFTEKHRKNLSRSAIGRIGPTRGMKFVRTEEAKEKCRQWGKIAGHISRHVNQGIFNPKCNFCLREYAFRSDFLC